MNVTDAVYARKSIREFLPDPVDDDTIRELLEKASRAPSGGNVQPWVVYVLNGESMQRFREHLAGCEPFEEPGYEIYPAPLWEPYRTNRFELGELMYDLLEIPRDDKTGRMMQFARNGDFFGAPAALFCYIDKGMGKPQWSDLGMFLQTFMLLAQEAGLDTCPQEYWAARHGAVGAFLEPPEDLMLFCGVAIGKQNPDAAVNGLESPRMPLDQWATFV